MFYWVLGVLGHQQSQSPGCTLSSNKLHAYVLVKPDGHPYPDNGFNAGWRAALLKAREQTGWPLDFTLQDIKAKAISDVAGSSRDKQRIRATKPRSRLPCTTG